MAQNKGDCSICNKEFELIANGKVPAHSEQWRTCEGSYQRPNKYTTDKEYYNSKNAGDYGDHTEVWVKAHDMVEAMTAAVLNGIPKEYIVRAYNSKPGEMVLLKIRGYHGVIMDWFCKPGQAPYPWGSCMLYRGEGN